MVNSKLNLENPAVFYDRFTRGRRLLQDMSVRVLGSSENVEEAVRNCFASASRNPPKFRSEAAFYCWLVRVLIDEALLIRRASPVSVCSRADFVPPPADARDHLRFRNQIASISNSIPSKLKDKTQAYSLP